MGFGSILQNQVGNLGLNIPIVPDDALVGKASLSRFGTWVYSDLILSLKPDIGEVDAAKPVSLTRDGRNNVTFGNQLQTQINRTINNISEENFLDGDPDSIRLQEVLLTVSLNKNASKTTISGRNDTVVEFLSNGSYQIQVEANLASSWARVYPERAVRKLIKILNSNEPVTVSGRQSNMWATDRWFIEGYSFPQRAGYVNQQKVSFTAISVSQNDTIDAKIEPFTP